LSIIFSFFLFVIRTYVSGATLTIFTCRYTFVWASGSVWVTNGWNSDQQSGGLVGRVGCVRCRGNYSRVPAPRVVSSTGRHDRRREIQPPTRAGKLLRTRPLWETILILPSLTSISSRIWCGTKRTG